MIKTGILIKMASSRGNSSSNSVC